jgi:hypothetical protein
VGRKLEQLLERPSRPFTPRAGPAWPARILQAGEFYHVKEHFVYCGVDIAKSYLDAAIANEKRRLANDAVGHREFIKWIKQIEGEVQVICEPSGGYERLFIQALVRAQIKVSLVQAKAARQTHHLRRTSLRPTRSLHGRSRGGPAQSNPARLLSATAGWR